MNWNPNKPKGTNVPPPSRLLHAPKAIRCPNCNAPVRPNQIRCDYCGSWFDEDCVEMEILYADNKPFMIVEKISDEVTEEIRRQDWQSEVI